MAVGLTPLVTATLGGIMLLWLGKRFLSEAKSRAKSRSRSRSSTLFICTTCNTAKREGVASGTASPVAEPVPTGPDMFRTLVNALVGCPKEEIEIEKGYRVTDAGGNILHIRPQRCLSACRQANCIALCNPEKFQYHFGNLNAEDPADIEDIIKFVEFYRDHPGDAFTKKHDRPPRLAKTLISRIPPINQTI